MTKHEVYSKVVAQTGPFSPTSLGLGAGPVLVRLWKHGLILRLLPSTYFHPKPTRFGPSSPSIDKVVQTYSEYHGYNWAPSIAQLLNLFHLSTQVPAKCEYLTTGPSISFTYRNLRVQLTHREFGPGLEGWKALTAGFPIDSYTGSR